MLSCWTDSICLSCSNPRAAKEWWMHAFGCKETEIPEDWDNRLHSDLALRLPGDDAPRILLVHAREIQKAGHEPVSQRAILFCGNLLKAREWLRAERRGTRPATG